jgi:arginase
MAALYENVAQRVERDIRGAGVPIVMSGDCTTSYGVVAGMQRAGISPSIVWFDAHGDVQTLETSQSGYIGGMPIRFLAGYRRDLLADHIGLKDVDESRILLTGARDIDPPEAEYLARAAVRQQDVEDVSAESAPDGSIYLHVDFDVVNPDHLPGLLYPATGGPSLETVTNAIKRILSTRRVAAVGLACTWHPGRAAGPRVHHVAKAILAASGNA